MTQADSSPLAGKTALITGAAKRLGRRVALTLAARGANVILHYHHSREAAEDTAAEIHALGRETWLVSGDLSDATAAASVLPQALERAGTIDFLINNASTFPESRLMDFTLSALEEQIRINAFAPLILSRAFAEHIQHRERANKKPGASAGDAAVVNLLDTRIHAYDAAHAAYHLSKRMLFSLTRMMALEFAPLVRVNAVAPGAVLAPADADDDHLARLAATIPLRRTGQPEDVARAVAYLLGERFITGQVIYVDGGEHMKGRLYD